jgi:3-hydroxyisobutyrate dehydrogenase
MSKIAFIGLGNMGGPMALNLLKAGHSLRVFDLLPTALATLKEAGATPCASAGETLTGADFVVSMLPSSPHVEELYLGAGGLLAKATAAQSKPLFIDCSTIAPESARKVASAAKQAGFDMIDAPVSGGTKGAADGTLTFIVGGNKPSLEKARTILEKMGKNIFHAGEAGAGQVAKICNNMLLAIHMAGSAEALALGVRNGLDPKTLSEIMLKSSGRNWSLEVYNPWPGVQETVPASRGYSGGFGTRLMKKDLGLALEAAKSSKTRIEMGALAHKLYDEHDSKGQGGLDFSSIVKLFE